MLQFNGHTTVVGLTQEGKTFATTKSLLEAKQGVLFFNTKLDPLPVSGYTDVDGTSSPDLLFKLLGRGRKVAFHPSRNRAARSAQLAWLISTIYNEGPQDLILAIDEVHLFDKRGELAMEELATTGLSKGYKGVWISQRYANINNTLMTQSTEHVIFRTVMEQEYFKRYGLPFDQIEQKLQQGGQYHFVTYDHKELRGPFKV